MKKILMISFVFLLLGCTETPSNIELDEDIKIEAEAGAISVKNETSSIEMTTDVVTGMKIPEWYPQDALPIYEPSTIIAATKSDDGTMMILGNAEDELGTLVEFYDEHLIDSIGQMVNSTEEAYLNLGYINGFSYNVTITVADMPFKSGFAITLVPDEAPMVDDQEPIINEINYGDMVLLPDHTQWPADYPEDIFPHYVDEVTEIRLISSTEGQNLIAFACEGSFEDVYSYYYDLLSTGSNFMSFDQDGTQIMMSSKGGYSLNVIIADNIGALDPNPRFKSLVEVIYIKE